jgi:RNA polymerase sigma-70 factor (ECF subfamily)
MLDSPLETIGRCQDGDAEAFAEVVARYERPLFAYVYRLQCTPVGLGPEDVVQEVFLKAYQHIKGFQSRENSSFSTWLFTIARNHCVSLVRRRQVQGSRVEDSEAALEGALGDPQGGNPLDPAERVLRQEAADHTAMAVGLLPEPLRSALVLRYYQDLDYASIAEILDCDEGTARTRVARAKKALLELLQHKSIDD